MRYIAFIIAICLSNYNCNKNNDDDYICDTTIAGSYSVVTNYENWNNSSCSFGNNEDNKISIKISDLDPYCNLNQIIIFGIFKKIGEIQLLHFDVSYPHHFNSSRLTEYTGEDGLTGWYDLDTTVVNKINIQNISEDGSEITGTFDLQFVPNSFLPPKYQETKYFKNGSFIAKLVK